MNRPFADDLLKKADSKYSLVIAAARRARELVDGEPALIDDEPFYQKWVTIALNEINEDKVIISR